MAVDLSSYKHIPGPVGVLVSDMTGFTRTVRARGSPHFAALILQQRFLLQAALNKHGVIHVFTEADDVIAVLPSGKAAFQAALEGAALIKAYNESQPDKENWVGLSGIAVDEGTDVYIAEEDGKIFGTPAARAFTVGEDHCEGAEVCLLDGLYEKLKDDADFSSFKWESDDKLKESDDIVFFHTRGEYKTDIPLPVWGPEGKPTDVLYKRLVPGADLHALDIETESHFRPDLTVVMFGDKTPTEPVQTYLSLRHKMAELTSHVFKAKNGERVSDTFFVFTNHKEALEATLEAREAINNYNASAEAGQKIVISGFGLHFGKVLWVKGTDIQISDAINTASKLGEDLAENTEILFELATHDTLKADGHLPADYILVQKQLEASGVIFNVWSIPNQKAL